MVLTITLAKIGRRKRVQTESSATERETPVAAPAASLCVLCLDSNNISGDCDVFRLPGSGVSVKSKLLKWERDRRPAFMGGSAIFGVAGSVGRGGGDVHPICRACLSLVSEMDCKEVDLNLLFTKFWMLVAHRREFKCGGFDPTVKLLYLPDHEPRTIGAVSSVAAVQNPADVGSGPEAVNLELDAVKREFESPEFDRPPPENPIPPDLDEPSGIDGRNSSQVESEMDVEEDGDRDDWCPSARNPKAKRLAKSESNESGKSNDTKTKSVGEIELPEIDRPSPEIPISPDLDEPSDDRSENGLHVESPMDPRDDDDWCPSTRKRKARKLPESKDSMKSKKSNDIKIDDSAGDVDDPSDEDSDDSFRIESSMEGEDEEDDDWSPSFGNPQAEKSAKAKNCRKSEKSAEPKKSMESDDIEHSEKSKDFICKACKKGFPTAPILNNHVRRRCLVLRAEREKNPSGQASSSETDGWKRRNVKKRTFVCDLCGRSHKDNYHLSRHRMSCEQRSRIKLNSAGGTENGKFLRRFACLLCEQSFDQIHHREEHERDVHPDALRFPCPKCDKKFVSSSYMYVHKQTHETVMCTVCGAESKGTGALKKHMRTHTREKAFFCKDCGEGYVHMSELMRHEWKKHGRYKERHELPCPICGKVLDSKRGLKMHKYSKHGILDDGLKIYKCDRCEKSFPKKTALAKHVMMHDGLKAHACSHPGCSYAAITFVSVKNHMKNVHKRNVKRVFPGSCKDETVYRIVDVDEV